MALENCSWYHGDLSRQQTENLLLQSIYGDGDFLVRRRNDDDGQGEHALSVRRAHGIAHFLIVHRNGAFRLSAAQCVCPPRINIPSLVAFYQLNRRAGIFLRNPVVKVDPSEIIRTLQLQHLTCPQCQYDLSQIFEQILAGPAFSPMGDTVEPMQIHGGSGNAFNTGMATMPNSVASGAIHYQPAPSLPPSVSDMLMDVGDSASMVGSAVSVPKSATTAASAAGGAALPATSAGAAAIYGTEAVSSAAAAAVLRLESPPGSSAASHTTSATSAPMPINARASDSTMAAYTPAASSMLPNSPMIGGISSGEDLQEPYDDDASALNVDRTRYDDLVPVRESTPARSCHRCRTIVVDNGENFCHVCGTPLNIEANFEIDRSTIRVDRSIGQSVGGGGGGGGGSQRRKKKKKKERKKREKRKKIRWWKARI
jgi:hypothetical protein